MGNDVLRELYVAHTTRTLKQNNPTFVERAGSRSSFRRTRSRDHLVRRYIFPSKRGSQQSIHLSDARPGLHATKLLNISLTLRDVGVVGGQLSERMGVPREEYVPVTGESDARRGACGRRPENRSRVLLPFEFERLQVLEDDLSSCQCLRGLVTQNTFVDIAGHQPRRCVHTVPENSVLHPLGTSTKSAVTTPSRHAKLPNKFEIQKDLQHVERCEQRSRRVVSVNKRRQSPD
mmetsp:Transcript_1779/g.4879  ORF Transcript_1779/g.4879 Transcript_1779/m.4879 type:complete len:233 (-) Transcript_1779:1390-2088(-)